MAANQKIAGQTFEKTTEGSFYTGNTTWSISFRSNGKYDISYKKTGAHKEDRTAIPDEEISLKDKQWKYDRTAEYSWVGDWNFHHTNHYYVFTLSEIPFHEGQAWFCIEKTSNLGHIYDHEPGQDSNGNDFSGGIPVAMKSAE